MDNLSDTQVKEAMQSLQNLLEDSQSSPKTLDSELSSAAKHVPAYVKVVKGHIEQLRQVLQLENHNSRSLENVNLAKPVEQLIEIFRMLEDEDVQLLEELSYAARNWQTETSEQPVTEDAESAPATTI